MNRLIAASALVTSLFVASIASAETDNALFPSNNAVAYVTFYRTAPTDPFPLATAMVNNSPVAATIDGIEAATYVTVAHEGESYSFPLAASGTNKNDLILVMPDGSTTRGASGWRAAGASTTKMVRLRGSTGRSRFTLRISAAQRGPAQFTNTSAPRRAPDPRMAAVIRSAMAVSSAICAGSAAKSCRAVAECAR